MKRKWFGRVFEGKNPRGTPEVQLRRMTREEMDKYGTYPLGTPVGIFWGPDLIAQVDLDDLFDADGNRFYND